MKNSLVVCLCAALVFGSADTFAWTAPTLATCGTGGGYATGWQDAAFIKPGDFSAGWFYYCGTGRAIINPNYWCPRQKGNVDVYLCKSNSSGGSGPTTKVTLSLPCHEGTIGTYDAVGGTVAAACAHAAAEAAAAK
jgi:hypothetical protein